MTRLSRTVKHTAAAIAVVVPALVITAVLVFQSGWFQERVRERIVRELVYGSGARVELGNFSFDWRSLNATVAPLILHGTESAAEPPMVRVEKVSIGLRVISALERRVDLSSVRLEHPSVYIAIYPDGKTNLPVPRAAQDKTSWGAYVVDLAVGRYEVVDGLVEFDDRQLPVNLRGEDLRLEMTFEAATKRYRGELASRHLHLAFPLATPVEFDTAATFTLERDRLAFTRLRLASGQTRVDLSGAVSGLRAPSGEFRVKALVAGRDVVAMFSLPLQPVGSATADGTLSVDLGPDPRFTLNVRATARGVGYTHDRINIRDATASAGLVWNPEGLTLRGLTMGAMGARFSGGATINSQGQLHLEGDFENMQLTDVLGALTARPVPWTATLAGGLTLDTAPGWTSVDLDTASMVIPASGVPTMAGQVALHYNQKSGLLRFDNSRLATGSTSVDFSGVPGESLDVRARSANLADVLPALELLNVKAPRPLPLQLKGGEISLSGTISGGPENAAFHGDASLTSASIQGHGLDRFSAQVDASAKEISLRVIDLARGLTQIQGDATLTARDGSFDDGAIAARFDIRNASLPELLKEGGLPAEIRGTATTAAARISGTVRHPEADATLDVLHAAAFGEEFDRVRGTLHYANGSIRFANGDATFGTGRVAFSGSYQANTGQANTGQASTGQTGAGQSGAHPAGMPDWTRGDLALDVNAQAIDIVRVAELHGLVPSLQGRLEGKFTARARLEPGAFLVRELSGQGTATRLTVYAEPLGDVTLTAETRGTDLSLRANAKFRDASVQGQGTWRLEGDLPGSATLRFSRLTVASLHDLVMIGASDAAKSAIPPFQGFVEGGATVSLPLLHPRQFQGELRVDAVQFMPLPSQISRPEVAAEDLVLKNAEPVVMSISAREARVRSARFTARDTNLEVSGTIPFDSAGGADLTVKGGVNLAILQLLNPDLLARGSATVSTAIRGSLRDPQVNGRLELKNASLYLNDVPSGVDSANGAVLFDRNRATLENLVAETGGGRIAFSGFLEFGRPLIYRLKADARQVRVRYPEDVSMTGNARLSLYGTSDASTLSGDLTLTRAAISANADLGKLLAAAARPSPAPEANDYFKGVRLDVHVQSAATLQLETALTRDVQASADLHLRGTPSQPVLLGEISVNSGEVQIFGNRYTVDRGEIRFLNPLKIEPTLDVALETNTRGITVNVALSGPPQRLTVNYSSDPPLQSREIIALLAVGRSPNTTAPTYDVSTAAGTTGFADMGGVLGQAVSEELSNRLQRFFGASRLKIDPTMTGVANLPEARLTFEQQVSRDISLTYITNLNRTEEQIVRLQWDLSPRWAAIAVRDVNGLFGIDLQFRKRFK
jgi:translocation and assembly module TamB